MSEVKVESNSYANGREAALRGCARMIWCGTNAEREAWFAGWDSIASDQRGTWPLTGPVPNPESAGHD